MSTRPRRPTMAAAGAVALACAGLAITVLRPSGSPASAAPSTAPPPKTVRTERRDLVEPAEFTGKLGYGASTPLRLSGAGMLTWLAAVGDTVDQGSKLAEVNGDPVVAVRGSFPYWRDLGPGVAAGKDVTQLEYMLAALGYAADTGLKVDQTFNAATAKALKAFQKAMGMPTDGILGQGEVVVIDAPKVISGRSGSIGQDAGEAGITVTDPVVHVHADIDVEHAALAERGDTVTLTVGGTSTEAAVTAVGERKQNSNGEQVVPVTIDGSSLNTKTVGATVQVTVKNLKATAVVAVPVATVLALAEGGYAVEVPDPGAGGSRLVAVQLGAFADGWVELIGDVQPGTAVVTP